MKLSSVAFLACITVLFTHSASAEWIDVTNPKKAFALRGAEKCEFRIKIKTPSEWTRSFIAAVDRVHFQQFSDGHARRSFFAPVDSSDINMLATDEAGLFTDSVDYSSVSELLATFTSMTKKVLRTAFLFNLYVSSNGELSSDVVLAHTVYNSSDDTTYSTTYNVNRSKITLQKNCL